MPYIHAAAIAERRRYWLRHDWKNQVRREAHHLIEPAPTEKSCDVDTADVDAAFRAELALLRASHDRARRMLAEVKYELAWRRIMRKFSADQPRVPAGNPDGGQWTSGSGGTIPPAADLPDSGRVMLTGGIGEDQLNLTVQAFVSSYCLGSINRQLPGQFMGVTIADVMAEAQRGNPSARMCLKLLMQDRFRK